MSLKGPLSKLSDLTTRLKELPRTVAIKIAEAAADEITSLARGTFAAGEDSYGNSWSPGADGQKITLRRSGALASYVRYVAIGTKLRVALGVAYAKYKIGKRPVFPRGKLPTAYAAALSRIAKETILRELGGAP